MVLWLKLTYTINPSTVAVVIIAGTRTYQRRLERYLCHLNYSAKEFTGPFVPFANGPQSQGRRCATRYCDLASKTFRTRHCERRPFFFFLFIVRISTVDTLHRDSLGVWVKV